MPKIRGLQGYDRLMHYRGMVWTNVLINGIESFERYAAWAVLSWNIQIVGCIVRDQEREKLQEQKQAA